MVRLALSFSRKTIAPVIASSLMLTLAPAAIAQSDGAEAVVSELPPGNSPEEVTQQKQANAEQARLAAQQAQQNRDNEAEYQRQLREVEEAAARIQNEHAEAQAAYEAEKARLEREHAQAMARWEADVAACRAGDISRCAPPAPGAN